MKHFYRVYWRYGRGELRQKSFDDFKGAFDFAEQKYLNKKVKCKTRRVIIEAQTDYGTHFDKTIGTHLIDMEKIHS